MRQFQKKRKLKIGIKWAVVFAFMVTIFFIYQLFLEGAYETQVVSWIGYSQAMKVENAVFLLPDEKSYDAGSKIMRAAGYEDNGKKYLKRNIGTYGRSFYWMAVLCGCMAGAALEIYTGRKREKEINSFVEQEKVAVYEQIRREKEFLQSERKKMGIYMENISHQLKTPMAGTMLYLDNLLEVEEDGAKKDRLQSCLKQLSWMKEMTIVLLRLAQIDSGKIWMKRKREDLTMLIEDCIERTMILAEEKKIEMLTDLEEKCIQSCDAFWIKEAVENVLKNAIEFTPQDGAIRVSMKENRNDYEIQIFNSGEKPDKGYQENIFDRFYQMGNKKTNGFGIGLNLAREIIKLHRGTLKVMDTDEAGTTFQFLIPKIITKDNS